MLEILVIKDLKILVLFEFSFKLQPRFHLLLLLLLFFILLFLFLLLFLSSSSSSFTLCFSYYCRNFFFSLSGAFCNQLEVLNVSGCKRVEDPGLRAIAIGCPRLTSLQIAGCSEVTGIALKVCYIHFRSTSFLSTLMYWLSLSIIIFSYYLCFTLFSFFLFSFFFLLLFSPVLHLFPRSPIISLSLF